MIVALAHRRLVVTGITAAWLVAAAGRDAPAQEGRDTFPVVAAVVNEAAGREGSVAPTALLTDAAPPALGVVPLGDAPSNAVFSAAGVDGPSGASAGHVTAPRPLADWRVLVAIAAAFAVLASLRFLPRQRTMPLPPDVFEVLGSAMLGGPHPVRIVRFGPKTLLVSVSASGCTTLAEITDAQATACIVAACRGIEKPLRPPSPGLPGGLKGVAAAGLLAVMGLVAQAADNPAEIMPSDVTPAEVVTPVTVPVLPEAAGWIGPGSIQAILPSALLFGVVSLAPAVLLMTTCFVRISVVLALLRQGLGTAQVPSNQILAALAIFLSALVMWPVWTQAWKDGVEPLQQGTLTPMESFDRGSLPIRRWMATQIEAAGNRDTMLMFLARHPDGPRHVATYDEVPVEALLPAFLVSELETAFTIGFRVLLPFLVIDILVATLVVSTGLVMLPPTLVSLPLKLLVFVVADGWTLVVQSLLDGLRTTTV
jgi:flagellar biosynthetic protein FliP